MLLAKFLAFSLAAVSGWAAASPAYLKCTFQYPDGVIENYFKIDEAHKQVTLGIPKTRYSENMTAIFDSDRITFSSDISSYQINRKEPSVIRYVRPIMETKIGKCEYLDPPKRVF